jgi:hypothetical protein
MGPEEINQRGVRIGLFVRVDVMDAMDRYPARRGVFHATNPEDRKGSLDPNGGFETAMGQQAMVADGDTLPKDVDSQDGGENGWPPKERWHEGQQCQGMDGYQCAHVDPMHRKRLDRFWDIMTPSQIVRVIHHQQSVQETRMEAT